MNILCSTQTACATYRLHSLDPKSQTDCSVYDYSTGKQTIITNHHWFFFILLEFRLLQQLLWRLNEVLCYWMEPCTFTVFAFQISWTPTFWYWFDWCASEGSKQFLPFTVMKLLVDLVSLTLVSVWIFLNSWSQFHTIKHCKKTKSSELKSNADSCGGLKQSFICQTAERCRFL